MKIDIFAQPPTRIFRHQPRYARLFVFFLTLAGLGLALGVYAYLHPASPWYGLLEKLSMILFVGASVPIFITGEKLQAYKCLSEQEVRELAGLRRRYEEIDRYCLRVEAMGRRLIHAEFNALRDHGEERELQAAQARDAQTDDKEG